MLAQHFLLGVSFQSCVNDLELASMVARLP
jgi:hypothetical protein